MNKSHIKIIFGISIVLTVYIYLNQDDIGFFNLSPISSSNKTFQSRIKDPSDNAYLKQEQDQLLAPSQSWIQLKVADVCNHLGFDPPMQKNWEDVPKLVQLKTYYSPGGNIIYSGIPKSGCTNWKFTILKLENMFKADKPDPRVHYIISKLSLAKFSYGLETLNQKYTFTVIRNPWTRMVSGYNDKFGTKRGQKWRGGFEALKILNRFRDPFITIEDVKNRNMTPTFIEFLNFLAFSSTSEINVHFLPQYLILPLRYIKFDYISVLEYGKQQSNDILSHFKSYTPNSKISLPGPYDSSLDPKAEKSAILAKEWLTKLDNKTLIEALYRQYKPDFMLCNYSNFTDTSFPLPLYFD